MKAYKTRTTTPKASRLYKMTKSQRHIVDSFRKLSDRYFFKDIYSQQHVDYNKRNIMLVFYPSRSLQLLLRHLVDWNKVGWVKLALDLNRPYCKVVLTISEECGYGVYYHMWSYDRYSETGLLKTDPMQFLLELIKNRRKTTRFRTLRHLSSKF